MPVARMDCQKCQIGTHLPQRGPGRCCSAQSRSPFWSPGCATSCKCGRTRPGWSLKAGCLHQAGGSGLHFQSEPQHQRKDISSLAWQIGCSGSIWPRGPTGGETAEPKLGELDKGVGSAVEGDLAAGLAEEVIVAAVLGLPIQCRLPVERLLQTEAGWGSLSRPAFFTAFNISRSQLA